MGAGALARRKLQIRVGIGRLPRGEVALIVALVGLQSRVVAQSTYAHRGLHDRRDYPARAAPVALSVPDRE